MTLQHINLENLHPSKTNVRKVGSKDIVDLVPSIEWLGLLQPLLVRPNCDGFEIIAGQRRYHALSKIAETTDIDPVPCLVMEEGDDARAIEASLTENIARLPMDEVDQYKAFAALIKQGLDVEEVASRFGVTTRLVRQRLAIAKLYTPILTAYRKQRIDASTVRTLTMASTTKQKEWWALFKSEDEYAPTGRELKAWLLGGKDIPVQNALFDLDSYGGAIITDLFGDKQYFDDADAYWELQNAAIAQAKSTYIERGWQEVIVLDVGAWWSSWEHVKAPKTKGGKIFVEISRDGEVTFHEGYITQDEAKRREKALADDAETKPEKPELTKAMQNYLALHRHAAVRTKLLSCQGLALRVATAQIIAGSDLWTVHADRQKAKSDAIADSLATNKAQEQFSNERDEILQLLGLEHDEENGSLVPTKDDWGRSYNLAFIFAKLIKLEDEVVTRIFTFVVAETLPSASEIVEILGAEMNVDLDEFHSPDDTFFDLLKDKHAINGMIAEIIDPAAAARQISDTAKAQKATIRSAMTLTNPDWWPRYFSFPMSAYTDRGGIVAIEQWEAFIASADDELNVDTAAEYKREAA